MASEPGESGDGRLWGWRGQAVVGAGIVPATVCGIDVVVEAGRWETDG